MKKYNVIIPCTMGVMVTVEAEDEKAAKEASFQVDFRVKIVGKNAELVEFETHDRISYGNVYCGCVNEMDVQEAE